MNYLKSLLFLMLIVPLISCGGGGDAPAPTISSFSASETSISAGASLSLTAVFANGTATIDNGVGSISSNVAESISPSATTTYTLTVTNSAGVSVTATLTVTVNVPTISSFTASPATAIANSAVNLRAVFSHGTGSVDNAVGDVTSSVSKSVEPAVTTIYTLTVTNNFGVSATSSVTVTVVPMLLSIVSPDENEMVADDLTITATVQTEFDIAFVQAVVGTRTANLSYSSDAICDGRLGCSPGFIGSLSLSGLVPDTYTLSVTAEDIAGRSVSEQTTIILDNNPGLTVAEPVQYSVATPEVPLNISCVDDAGDCEISVKINNILASATNTLVDSLDLSSYEGQQVSLVFEGRDSASQLTTVSRTVYVESSSGLALVKDFSGKIIDFDGQNVLIKTTAANGDGLAVASISSAQVTTVDVPAALVVSATRSFLTATGVIYTTTEVGGNVLSANIYDWNNGQLYNLGHPNSAHSLRVAGDYAIWSVSSNLWRRQLSTRTNIQISNDAGNWKNAIASNGVVGFWAYGGNYSVIRYQGGSSTTLATDSNYWNSYVESDGLGFLYRKHDPCCSNQQYAITFHNGSIESALTVFRDKEPSPGRDYQINNGWVAFTELGAVGQTHVWSRDTGGSLLQRTIYGSDSTIDTLSADGEIMMINAGNRYLSDTSAQSTLVSSTLGMSSKKNGIWYIAIGRSLFSVN